MYDSENDYLICSQPLHVFTESECLDKSSTFFLWMVLHYGIFSGTVNLKVKLENNVPSRVSQTLKAEFINRAGEKRNVYREQLKFCEESILRPKEEHFPKKESLDDGKKVF